MTTLPKEIEEEFIDIWENFECECRPYPCECLGNAIKQHCLKVYTTARRQALTDGIEAMPKRQGSVQDPINDSFRAGCNAYRAEAIAKLTQLRDV